VRILCLLIPLVVLCGCEDKYQTGYAAGHAAGYAQANAAAERRVAEVRAELERENRDANAIRESFNSVETTVCGGGGVNLNGKHYSGGKTGCVQVLSNGTVRRY